MTSCGYTIHEIIGALHVEPIVEEESVIGTIDQDFQVPPCNYQEENEGQEDTTETLEHIVDALDNRIPTPLPPLEITCRRNPKRIQVDEILLNSIEGTLSKCSIAYQTQQILNKYFFLNVMEINVDYFYHC